MCVGIQKNQDSMAILVAMNRLWPCNVVILNSTTVKPSNNSQVQHRF